MLLFFENGNLFIFIEFIDKLNNYLLLLIINILNLLK